MINYTIGRFEQNGEQLFICISGPKTYLEHFFDESEKADVKGTIEKLVAELELKEEAYVAPLPVVDKMGDLKAITISPTKVATAKLALIQAKVVVPIEVVKPVVPVEVVEKPVVEPITKIIN